MATSKFAQIIGVFCMLCATNTPSIPIFMARSAGVNFSFDEFTRCNTNDILCVNDATVSGHKINLTNNTNTHYKLTNKTIGRVIYNQTIQLSSLASFSTDIKFVMKYFNWSSEDGEGGIAFFMTSKEMATRTHSAFRHSGLPGNESNLSPKTFGVGFYCYSSCFMLTYAAGFLPSESVNVTQLDQPLYDGTLWTARMEYNYTDKYLKILLSNAYNSSLSQSQLLEGFDLFQYLPGNLVVGISASGENFSQSQTHTILSWSFNSNNKSRNSSISFIPKSKTRKPSMKLIIVATLVALFCLTGTIVLWRLFVIVRKKKRFGSSTRQLCEENETELDMILYQGPCKYKLEDLKVGTNNFCDALKLGQGGFGDVYKGLLKVTNQVVAVKRISERSRQGIKEFISEVSIVSRVRHRNLVQLLGWCREEGQLILVYEYMPNGSLDKYLFGKGDSPILQWCHRYRIAMEIACGLLYLHEEWAQCIVHRDVKSSNIMLDSDFNARLGDFGLARMLEHNRLSQTTIAAGTFGYLAPECVTTGRTSPQSDVYSFGAVALEIATGRRAVDTSLEEHNMRLVEWVWDLYGQGKVLEAADARLDGEFDKAGMEQLVGIGLWCSHPDPAERPKMSQVVKLLKMEAQVPQLPLALPVPTYAAVQEENFSAISSFTAGHSQASAPYSASASSQATTSSKSVAVGSSSTATQVSSSSNSSTLTMALHCQKQE